MHRFTWDLHYPPAPGSSPSWGIGATPFNTATNPSSPYVMPGTYTVRLIVDGKTMTLPLTVKMDPRVKTPLAGLGLQFSLSKMLYDDIAVVHEALRELRGLRAQLTPLKEKQQSNQTYTQFAAKAEALESGAAPNLASVNGSLRSILGLLQTADVAPPSQNVAAANELHKNAGDLLDRWKALKEGIESLNKELGTTLKAAALPPSRVKPVFETFEEDEEAAAEP
jgi:PKD repeat protein